MLCTLSPLVRDGGRTAGLALTLTVWPLLALQGGPRPVTAQTPSESDLVVDYPVFSPMRPPAVYAQALAGGTRTESGRPGPAYWQQEVQYTIAATLDPARGTVTGTETIRYTNRAPSELPLIVLRLYQNVFGPGVQRNRPVALTGGVRLDRIAWKGQTLELLTPADLQNAQGGTPPGYLLGGTIAQVVLPEPLPSGATGELEVAWEYRIPGETAFRTGNIDGRIFTIAQWYPQIAVVDDVYGIDLTPYLGDGEFYLDYGSFDVALTVPEGWLVAATGELQNADSLLPAEARERLAEALASDTAVRILDASELAAGATGGAVRTWRYRAESVRDFAFAASDRYVWDAVGADVGGEQGRVPVHAFYDPSIEHWKEAAGYSKHALEYLSRYLVPYPYPHATAVYGPVGGMEYPMVVFIGRSQPEEPLYSVLAHELAHEWFPMVVGSPEARFAWMDEGFATYNESLARSDFFGNQLARLQDQQLYLRAALADVEAPLMRHTDHVESGFGRSVAAYSKPATLLHSLRRLLGEEVFDRAFRAYAEAWAYKHPYPWDFFAMLETGSGRDLDWFWQAWFYGTVTLDQSIEEVALGDGSVRVTVANLGGGVMPVEIGIEFADGTTQRVDWSADVWAGTRRITRDIPVRKEVVRIVLDPEQHYPDIDRRNNVWPEDRL